eukprot:822492-Prymnesium_polylepis.1
MSPHDDAASAARAHGAGYSSTCGTAHGDYLSVLASTRTSCQSRHRRSRVAPRSEHLWGSVFDEVMRTRGQTCDVAACKAGRARTPIAPPSLRLVSRVSAALNAAHES